MVAGGTGGHIFPALAVAAELVARSKGGRSAWENCEIEFLGTTRGLESKLVPAAGFPLRTIAAAGLIGISGWKKWRNLLVLPRSAVQTSRVLREFEPDVVLGVGGYIAGPAVLQAALQDIPTLLFEPNAVPGFTNRVLAPVVLDAAVGFPQTARYYGTKAHITGHPVRKAFAGINPRKHASPYTILVLGGSQGSMAINEWVIKSLPLLAPGPARLAFLHQTGEREYNTVREAYRRWEISAEVCAFIDDMPSAFSRADLVISRAGAMTVAELGAAGKAALLIPFPAAAQHQLENARAMERAGAARVIDQAELTPERLVLEITDLLSDPSRLVQMEQTAKKFAHPEAARHIAELIEGLAR
jgi:UDP-N-acetylglucosamine--N-acetylmuramyl-(pentapeptide) pyrophosphoryl-undecaprenol N-acetylglucosamine transferase